MTVVTKDIDLAIKFLDEGRVICYPTDTVYGIGCRINFIEGVKRIFEIKHRDIKKPLSIIVYDIERCDEFAKLDHKMRKFILQHLDEPYTFIVPKTDKVDRIITGGKDSVGIRIVSDKRVKRLCKSYPIIGTSANLSGKPPATCFDEIDDAIKKKVDLILKGECRYKKPSTVIDLITYQIKRR